jgi:hypothetical protein
MSRFKGIPPDALRFYEELMRHRSLTAGRRPAPLSAGPIAPG